MTLTTRDKCKLLRAALENVLTDLGRKLDMKIVVGNSIRFTDSEITVKLVASLPSATGEIESVEARAFKANAWRYRERLVTDDYWKAPAGEGPQAATWKDKPHRLVYDLVGEVEFLRARLLPELS